MIVYKKRPTLNQSGDLSADVCYNIRGLLGPRLADIRGHVCCMRTSIQTSSANFGGYFEVEERRHGAHEVSCVARDVPARSSWLDLTIGSFLSGRKLDQWGHAKLDSKLEGHEDAITCFAVGGTFLYSGSADRTVRIWDTSPGDALKTLTFHKVASQALLFLPDSGFVASCAFDGRVVLWDPQQERASSELQT